MRRLFLAVIVALAAAACGPPQKSAAGFHLPDGDPHRGRDAFLDLRCNACHTVEGQDMPGPVARPPVPIVLGGNVETVRTDGELVTAIVNPSHRIGGWLQSASLQSGSLSRMGDFNEAMTVQQLVDIVAFLHTRYRVRPLQYPPHR